MQCVTTIVILSQATYISKTQIKHSYATKTPMAEFRQIEFTIFLDRRSQQFNCKNLDQLILIYSIPEALPRH